MVATAERPGVFRSQLDTPRDLRGREIWIRAAEVYDGKAVPDGATGFLLGLEDASGVLAWTDSDLVGALPRPLDRRDYDLSNESPTRQDDAETRASRRLLHPEQGHDIDRADRA